MKDSRRQHNSNANFLLNHPDSELKPNIRKTLTPSKIIYCRMVIGRYFCAKWTVKITCSTQYFENDIIIIRKI